MKRILLTLSIISLAGCVHPSNSPWPESVQPIDASATQSQGQCFAAYKKFLEQAGCIESDLTKPNVVLNPYTQEYLAYLQSLQEKVRNKKLSGNDARAKLAAHLNEINESYRAEMMQRDQLEYQRAAQNAEILRQYQANQQQIMATHPTYVPVPFAPVVNTVPQYQAPLPQQIFPSQPQQTNCIMGRDRLQCVSSPHY